MPFFLTNHVQLTFMVTVATVPSHCVSYSSVSMTKPRINIEEKMCLSWRLLAKAFGP